MKSARDVGMLLAETLPLDGEYISKERFSFIVISLCPAHSCKVAQAVGDLRMIRIEQLSPDHKRLAEIFFRLLQFSFMPVKGAKIIQALRDIRMFVQHSATDRKRLA